MCVDFHRLGSSEKPIGPSEAKSHQRGSKGRGGHRGEDRSPRSKPDRTRPSPGSVRLANAPAAFLRAWRGVLATGRVGGSAGSSQVGVGRVGLSEQQRSAVGDPAARLLAIRHVQRGQCPNKTHCFDRNARKVGERAVSARERPTLSGDRAMLVVNSGHLNARDFDALIASSRVPRVDDPGAF
jgi:hypothetical protein